MDKRRIFSCLLALILALMPICGIAAGEGLSEPPVEPGPAAEKTAEPTAAPTEAPTAAPTEAPTAAPTAEPTAVPTVEPTPAPTAEPTPVPTAEPTAAPTAEPTETPEPTPVPADYTMSVGGSYDASLKARGTVVIRLTVKKSGVITIQVTGMDLALALKNEKTGDVNNYKTDDKELTLVFNAPAGDHLLTFTAQKDGASGSFTVKVFQGEPTPKPTEEPTPAPTEEPTAAPTEEPTPVPTEEPTAAPTAEPTPAPTEEPTAAPTEEPTPASTEEPTAAPTEEPTPAPTEEPTAAPTEEPTPAPTEEPTAAPTEEPTPAPTAEPTAEPTAGPTAVPDPYPEHVSITGHADVWAAEQAEMAPASFTAPRGEYVVEAYLLGAETDCRLYLTGEGLHLYRLDETGAPAEDLGWPADGANVEMTMFGYALTAQIDVEVRSTFTGVIRRGDTVTLTAIAHGPATAVFTWECDRGDGFETVEGVTGDTLTFEATAESLKWLWRVSAMEE